MKDIKLSTHTWMKANGKFGLFNGWQEGYGAFTYSAKEKHAVIEYIKNQKQHHYGETFKDEYCRLLIEHDVEFDEQLLL